MCRLPQSLTAGRRPSLIHDLPVNRLGREHRVTDLDLFPVHSRDLGFHALIFRVKRLRLAANIAEHGLHLVGIIIFFLHNVDMDRVEIFLI